MMYRYGYPYILATVKEINGVVEVMTNCKRVIPEFMNLNTTFLQNVNDK